MVTPDEMIGAFGADTFRVYEMSTGPLEQSRPWETKAVVGSQRLLQRIWRVVVDEETGAVRAADDVEPDEETLRALHRTIAGRAGRADHAAVQHRDRADHRADQPPDGRRTARRRRCRGRWPSRWCCWSRRWPRTWPRSCGRGWAMTGRWPGRRSRWPTSVAGGGHRAGGGPGERQGARAGDRAGRRRRRGAGGGRAGRREDRRLAGRARRCAASSPSPAGWSTSSSADPDVRSVPSGACRARHDDAAQRDRGTASGRWRPR